MILMKIFTLEYIMQSNDNVEEKNHEDLCSKYIMPGKDIYENNHENL